MKTWRNLDSPYNIHVISLKLMNESNQISIQKFDVNWQTFVWELRFACDELMKLTYS